MGYIKKLKNNELVGGTDKTTIYPVTSTEAVFEEITNGNESSFKSQKNINKEHNTTLNNHEERLQTAEAEDVKSITINGSTKKFEVDDKNNVDLTIYTVDSDPDMPGIADNVRDLRNMVGTSTPVLETSHKTRIETLEGGESVTGSVENKIKTKVDSINSSYQDDNNEYVKYSMTQTSGKVTNFNIDETSLKNAVTSLNTSISGDNIVIRSGSTPSGTGEAGKIYRYVNSSNNTYTDYMYSGGSWVTLATHDTSNEQAQVAYYTCTATGSGAQATKQFVGNGSLTYTPSSGGHIKILMGEANTATGTIYLQFGTTTSTKKPLYYNGEPVSANNTWEAGETIAVYYDPSANSNTGAYFASNAQGGGRLEFELAHILDNHERRVRETESHKLGEDEELVIARALQESSGGGGGESSLSGTVTIANSDCIMIIGSSFGAGYTMEGKHWTDIVSMFSDYCFQNVSLSGTSSLDRMNSLLAGTIVPRQNAKYAFVVNSENTSVNQKYLLKEIDNLCKVCLSFGMEPIIGTSYRNYLGNYQENMYVSSLYRDYCEKHNYIFMDAAQQYQLLMKGRYDFNRGGSHIGEREIPVVAYAYMDALHGMERPVKSIKVFMPRESVEDIDNLVFNGTVGRAKRFKEYLMNNYTDSNLTFPLGYALISATIPSEQKNTKIVELELNPSTDVTVYTRKTNQSPWPTKTNPCTRFHIEDEISVPAVNDTYTYNGTTFTVKHVNTQAEDGSYGTFCDIYCTPNLSSSTTTGGTLVRASGSGEVSIDFSSYNVDTTYTPDSDLIDAFNGGHWVEVGPNDRGNYSIVNLLGIMDIDRIDFLVKANNGNSFNINSGSIKINWSASELKTNYRRLPVEKFHCHFVSGGQELLPEPTFGAEGTTQSTWKDGQGNYLVSEANYEKSVKGKSGVYPMDATSIIKVSNSVSMNYTIPASSLPDYGQVEVEVVARNFGTSINSVTVNSWDFNELKLGFGGVTNSGRTYSEMSEQVGLFWKICHFTIDIMYYTGASSKRQLPIKIYAEKAGMEIARVSVKVKN